LDDVLGQVRQHDAEEHGQRDAMATGVQGLEHAMGDSSHVEHSSRLAPQIGHCVTDRALRHRW
jgi:hypothetical protein